jgi:hypothetical protein
VAGQELGELIATLTEYKEAMEKSVERVALAAIASMDPAVLASMIQPVLADPPAQNELPLGAGS